MTVFTSRTRSTFLRRREQRRRVVMALGFVLFVLILGRVGYLDARDRQVAIESPVRNVVAEVSAHGPVCARIEGQ